jgi:hypothetical protein
MQIDHKYITVRMHLLNFKVKIRHDYQLNNKLFFCAHFICRMMLKTENQFVIFHLKFIVMLYMGPLTQSNFHFLYKNKRQSA